MARTGSTTTATLISALACVACAAALAFRWVHVGPDAVEARLELSFLSSHPRGDDSPSPSSRVLMATAGRSWRPRPLSTAMPCAPPYLDGPARCGRDGRKASCGLPQYVQRRIDRAVFGERGDPYRLVRVLGSRLELSAVLRTHQRLLRRRWWTLFGSRSSRSR